MKNDFRALYVLDQDLEIVPIINMLEGPGFNIVIETTDNKEDMKNALQNGTWDLVFSDYYLKNFDVNTALSICHGLCPDIPFIIISGPLPVETVVDLMKAGVDNILSKDQPKRIKSFIYKELDEVKIKMAKRLATQKLVEDEKRFRCFFEHGITGNYISTPDGLLLDCNKAFYDILGYMPSDLDNLNWLDINHPDDLQKCQEAIDLLLCGAGDGINLEMRFFHKDGSIIWAELNTVLRRDSKGMPDFFINTINDITERKRTEKALIESEESYRLLIENQGEGVGTVNLDEVFIFANPAADQMFGVPKGKLVNRCLLDFIVPGQVLKIKEESAKRARSERSTYEVEIMTPDGENRCLLVTATPQVGPNGKITGTFGIFRDITESIRANKALIESEERFRSLFEGSPDAIFLADPESGIILDANRAASRLTGKSKNELVGLYHYQLHPRHIQERSKDNFRHIRSKAYQMESVRSNESWILNSDGKEIPTEILTSLIILKGKEAVQGVFRDITERRNAENELIIREKKYRELANSLPISVYETDLTGKITFANATAFDWFKYSKEELVAGLNIMQCVNDKDLSMVSDRFRQIIIQGLPITNEYEAKRRDGSTFPVLASTFTIKEDGMTVGVRGTLVDISQRKDAENKLKRSEQTLSTLISNLPGFVYRCKNDKDWTMEFLSEGFSKITGYPVADVLESGTISFNEIIHPDYRDYIWEQSQITQSLGVPFEEEYPLITKDGETRWVWERGTGICDESGNLVYNDGFITDITEKKRIDQIQRVLYSISTAVLSTKNLEELLGLIRDQLGSLLDTRNFYVAFYDEETGMLNSPLTVDQKNIMHSWLAEKSLTGYLIKQKKALLISAEDCKKLVESGEIEMVGTSSVMWLGVPLLEKEKIIGALVVQSYDNPHAYDTKDLEMLEFITHQISVFVQRKRAEDELLAALAKAEESDRLKSAFLATMNHELRTPLNHILGFSELILSGAMPEDNVSFASSINTSGRSLLAIVEDMFDLALTEQANVKIRLQTFRLMDQFMENKVIFDQILQNSGKADQIRLIYKPDTKLLSMYVTLDRSKVNQVLNNLFKNSIKFTDIGTIEYGCQRNEPGKLTFYIKDTGIGIPKEKQSVIFDFFRQGDDSPTRAYGGIGIGLSISMKISKILKGELSVVSEPGEGSTFFFTLPVELEDVTNPYNT